METGERLTLEQVATALGGISTKTVKRLITARQFPPGFLYAGTWYWWQRDLDCYEWLASRGTFAPLPPEKPGDKAEDADG